MGVFVLVITACWLADRHSSGQGGILLGVLVIVCAGLAFWRVRRTKTTFLVIFFLVLAAAMFAPAAGAEEFFRPDEKQAICAVVAEVFPGVGVRFNDTCVGDTGLLIGPMPTGKFLFIFVKRDGRMFTYKPPAQHEWSVLQICKAVDLLMNFWDGQRALGPGPK